MSKRKQTHFIEPRSYFRGRQAREEGMTKIVPPTFKSTDYWWWLAGWNDRDTELGSKQEQDQT